MRGRPRRATEHTTQNEAKDVNSPQKHIIQLWPSQRRSDLLSCSACGPSAAFHLFLGCAFVTAASRRAMGSKADLFATPGVVPEGERAEVEAATKGFVFQQTM